MTRRDGGGPAAFLAADTVLGQIEVAVLVTDQAGHLRYANSHAAALFGFAGGAGHLVGRPGR